MTPKEKRFIKLGWTVLEAKYFYYRDPQNKYYKSDDWYDKIELEYIELAKELGKEPTAYCVGFPEDRPCGKLVMEKCRQKKFKYTIEFED
ncbi:MAG: hypothetical protein ACFFKA_08940 [Candidatus Thorarchaeota archaeon]